MLVGLQNCTIGVRIPTPVLMTDKSAINAIKSIYCIVYHTIYPIGYDYMQKHINCTLSGILYVFKYNGDVAQLVERYLEAVCVGGSNPSIPTKRNVCLFKTFRLVCPKLNKFLGQYVAVTEWSKVDGCNPEGRRFESYQQFIFGSYNILLYFC